MEIRNNLKQFVLGNEGVVAQNPAIESDALDTAPPMLPPPPALPAVGLELGATRIVVRHDGEPLSPPAVLAFANEALRNDNEIVRAAAALVIFFRTLRM